MSPPSRRRIRRGAARHAPEDTREATHGRPSPTNARGWSPGIRTAVAARPTRSYRPWAGGRHSRAGRTDGAEASRLDEPASLFYRAARAPTPGAPSRPAPARPLDAAPDPLRSPCESRQNRLIESELVLPWWVRSVGLAPLASRAASSNQRAERRPAWPPRKPRPRAPPTARPRARDPAPGRAPCGSRSTKRIRVATAGD